MDIRFPGGRRWPVAVTVGLTAAGTVLGRAVPAVSHALRRDPHALAHGQVWRLVTPVLVQSDRQWWVVAGVLWACAAVGVAAARRFPPRRWFALYLLGALAGHGLGETFQPYQSGTSVAFCGLLGGLAARLVLDAAAPPERRRAVVALAVPAAVADLVARDIHGLPFLVGAAVTAWWLRAGQARSVGGAAPEHVGQA